ncbi:MAG TPA: hypothetical protein VEQ66_00950, partial [Propionibacteriaceae bacterium]|nr:hypothetical protein [Propionibacteriaceae bacterium]
AEGTPLPPAGTALALSQSQVKHQGLEPELEFLTMTDTDDVQAGARILEIFLDRLAWAAARTHDLSAQYLLDDRYASGLNQADRTLRDALNKLEQDLPDEAHTSPGWARVRSTLISLGAREGLRRST